MIFWIFLCYFSYHHLVRRAAGTDSHLVQFLDPNGLNIANTRLRQNDATTGLAYTFNLPKISHPALGGSAVPQSLQQGLSEYSHPADNTAYTNYRASGASGYGVARNQQNYGAAAATQGYGQVGYGAYGTVNSPQRYAGLNTGYAALGGASAQNSLALGGASAQNSLAIGGATAQNSLSLGGASAQHSLAREAFDSGYGNNLAQSGYGNSLYGQSARFSYNEGFGTPSQYPDPTPSEGGRQDPSLNSQSFWSGYDESASQAYPGLGSQAATFGAQQNQLVKTIPSQQGYPASNYYGINSYTGQHLGQAAYQYASNAYGVNTNSNPQQAGYSQRAYRQGAYGQGAYTSPSAYARQAQYSAVNNRQAPASSFLLARLALGTQRNLRDPRLLAFQNKVKNKNDMVYIGQYNEKKGGGDTATVQEYLYGDGIVFK